MAFPDQLLALAKFMASAADGDFQQANLRRAVSTAYYALFHLLVAATSENWNQSDSRAEFGRLLDHGKMKAACVDKRAEIDKFVASKPPNSPQVETSRRLRIVADAFIQLHQQRTEADYLTTREWTQTQAEVAVKLAESAFESWTELDQEPQGQRLLFAFIAKNR